MIPSFMEEAKRAALIRDLEHQCLVLAMGLYHYPANLAVETERVMELWRNRVEDELGIR